MADERETALHVLDQLYLNRREEAARSGRVPDADTVAMFVKDPARPPWVGSCEFYMCSEIGDKTLHTARQRFTLCNQHFVDTLGMNIWSTRDRFLDMIGMNELARVVHSDNSPGPVSQARFRVKRRLHGNRS